MELKEQRKVLFPMKRLEKLKKVGRRSPMKTLTLEGEPWATPGRGVCVCVCVCTSWDFSGEDHSVKCLW